MGRPINKKYFGSGNTGHEIKVTAKIGSSAVGDGFIVKQRGTRKFVVTVGADTGVCTLVDKAANALGENEMIINVLTDANTTGRVTKLYNRVAIVNGQKVQWNFDKTLDDSAVQVADTDEPAVSVVVISIDTQPASATVAVGGTFTASVVASATNGNAVTYQWEVSKDAGATWKKVNGAKAAEISVANVAADQDGHQYRVVVSAGSSVSETSDVATLTVA